MTLASPLKQTSIKYSIKGLPVGNIFNNKVSSKKNWESKDEKHDE